MHNIIFLNFLRTFYLFLEEWNYISLIVHTTQKKTLIVYKINFIFFVLMITVNSFCDKDDEYELSDTDRFASVRKYLF